MTAILISAAMQYAQHGWHVLPCGQNKMPCIPKDEGGHGVNDATTDEATLRAWWQRWPDALIGVACRPSGLDVLDLDIEPAKNKNGIAAFAAIAGTRSHGASLEAQTPRGGRHLVYRTDAARPIVGRVEVLPGSGIDWRTAGSNNYIIVPPATKRVWIDDREPWAVGELAPVPEWIRDELGKAKAEDATGGAPDEWAKILAAGAPEGIRNATVASLAGHYLAHGIKALEVIALLEPFAMRCSPPMDLAELRKTVESVERTDQRQHPERHAPDIEITLGKPSAAESEPSQGADEGVRARKPGSIRLSDWRAVAELPPVEWQVEGLIPEQALAVLAGDTQAGKSFLAIDLGLRLVHAMPFCGRAVTPGSVIYLAGEGHAGLAGRLNAWRDEHVLDPAQAEGRYLVIGDGIPVLNRATMGRLEELVAMVAKDKGHAPALLVIDTLSQALDDDENDAKVISPVMRGLSDVRKRFGCSVLIVHHLVKKPDTKHAASTKPTLDSIRGSGAITRNADSTLGLVAETDGTRQLIVWKQKDGAKPEPIGLRLLAVPTGRRRRGGQEETSCILVPDVAVGVAQRVDPAAAEKQKKAAVLAQDIAAILAALVTGPASSIDAAVARAGLNLQRGRASFRVALDDGRIVDSGTSKKPCYTGGRRPPVPPAGRRGRPAPRRAWTSRSVQTASRTSWTSERTDGQEVTHERHARSASVATLRPARPRARMSQHRTPFRPSLAGATPGAGPRTDPFLTRSEDLCPRRVAAFSPACQRRGNQLCTLVGGPTVSEQACARSGRTQGMAI